jgi:transaldolase
VTTIFSPAQAYLAREAGARYLIPYMNRSTRLMGDGADLIASMAQVVDGGTTAILAASIKSSVEAIAALNAGAHHLTLPLQVIKEMAYHPLSEQAIEQFSSFSR